MTPNQSLALVFGAPVLMIAAVFATGSSFGQRCTEAGYTGAEWEICVNALSNGKVADLP